MIDGIGPPPIAGIAKTAHFRPATLPDNLPIAANAGRPGI